MTTPTDPEDEHARLKLAREAKNLTQAELGKQAQIDRQSVSRHESGRSRISPPALTAYCRVLGLSEEWLKFGVGPGPGESANEAVNRYLRMEAGKNTPPWVVAMLRRVSYRSLGVRRMSWRHVHRVRELIEMNVALDPTMRGDAESVPEPKPPRRRR